VAGPDTDGSLNGQWDVRAVGGHGLADAAVLHVMGEIGKGQEFGRFVMEPEQMAEKSSGQFEDDVARGVQGVRLGQELEDALPQEGIAKLQIDQSGGV
jgi:hypothetical protein